jgi:UrcA family protein
MTVARIAPRSTGVAILLAVALCAAGFSTRSAAVAPDADRVELKVTAAGLDLNTPEGVGTFFGRITAAAEKACGPDDKMDLKRAALYKRCYNQAIVDVIRTINRPILTQLYVARYPSEAAQFGINENSVAAK